MIFKDFDWGEDVPPPPAPHHTGTPLTRYVHIICQKERAYCWDGEENVNESGGRTDYIPIPSIASMADFYFQTKLYPPLHQLTILMLPVLSHLPNHHSLIHIPPYTLFTQ